MAVAALVLPTLQELSPYRDCVVSTGGGVVTLAANWGQMQSGVVVWLSGSPELLASRVLADGAASRPLLEQQVRGPRWTARRGDLPP